MSTDYSEFDLDNFYQDGVIVDHLVGADTFPATAEEAAKLIVADATDELLSRLDEYDYADADEALAAIINEDQLGRRAQEQWAKLVVERGCAGAEAVFDSYFPTFEGEVLVSFDGALENSVENHEVYVEISPHDDEFDHLLRDVADGDQTIEEASAWWKEHAKARFDAECEVHQHGGFGAYQEWTRRVQQIDVWLDYEVETARMVEFVEAVKFNIEQLSAESLDMVQDSLRRECGVSDVPDSWITAYAVADACLEAAEESDGGVDIHGFKRKDLMMIPARLAMALQADGWWLRSEIIWHKPNAMPDSAKDRPGVDHEKIYLLSKSQRYFYDAEAVKVPSAGTGGGNFSAKTQAGRRSVIGGGQVKERQPDTGFRNLRTVWSIPTQPYRGAHFAPFPTALVEPCIKAASRPGDAVLDPFDGSGTTGLVAGALGRHTVLCELNPAYAELARQRLVEGLGMYAQVEMLPEPDIRIAA